MFLSTKQIPTVAIAFPQTIMLIMYFIIRGITLSLMLNEQNVNSMFLCSSLFIRFSWRNIKPLVVEFLGVPLIKPWLWWSYPFMEVSWQWIAFRNRLPFESSDDLRDR